MSFILSSSCTQHTLQSFYGPLSRTTQVSPVPEETFTHPPSWSSCSLYQLLPSTTIHSILPVQITCLAIFLHNLCSRPVVLFGLPHLHVVKWMSALWVFQDQSWYQHRRRHHFTAIIQVSWCWGFFGAEFYCLQLHVLADCSWASTIKLGNCYNSPQQYYLHHLHTLKLIPRLCKFAVLR